MSKLIMLRGLPASGKSSRARKVVEADYSNNTVRINKDDIRLMLHDGEWSKWKEKIVLETRDALIRQNLSSWRTVIVDDTNLAPKHEARLSALSHECEVDFEVMDFDVSVFECISRDSKRDATVGYEVIMWMYERYIQPKQWTLGDDEKEEAYIFDIDGTLATMHNRHPYEWDKVWNDLVNHEVRAVLNALKASWYSIVIMTWRDGVCEKETRERLSKYTISYDELHIRKEWDQRKDYVVKEEMLDNCLQRFKVMWVFDDRQQTAEMFRSRGLRVFNVAYGCF